MKMNHIIQKQTLAINLSDRKKAFEQQAIIRSLYWDRIVPKMEQVFQELIPADQYIRLDRLDLDLGIIPLEQLEEVMVQQVTKVLKEALIKIKYEKPHHKSDQILLNQKTSLSPRQGNRLKAFYYFLDKGLFPWWFSGKEQSIYTPTDLIQKMTAAEVRAFIELWPQWASTKVRQRLTQQFTFLQLQQFLMVEAVPTMKNLGALRQALLLINPNFSAIKANWKNTVEKTLITVLIEYGFDKSTTTKSQQEWIALLFPRLANALKLSLDRLEYVLEKTMDTQHDTPSLKLLQEYFKDQIKTRRRTKQETKQTNENNLSDDPINETGQKEQQTAKPSEEKSTSTPSEDKITKESKSKIDLEESLEKKDSEVTRLVQEGVYLQNAGMVLFAPFLQIYFDKLGLTQNQTFISTQHQEQALQLSHYLCTGKVEVAENELLLNKIMTGWPLDEPVKAQLELSPLAQSESTDLLQSLLKHWGALGNTTVDGLRQTFFQREGKLIDKKEQYHLIIERKTIDLLLNRVPWSFGLIQLPWMEKRLSVEW